MEEIEKEMSSIGMMNDKPGTGKTYVILSLLYNALLRSSKTQCNIIVIPQNLVSQWKSSIQMMNVSHLYFYIVKDYADIMSMYQSDELLCMYPILIIPSYIYHAFSTTIQSLNRQKKIEIERIIYDEMDSIESFIQMEIPCNHLWFVSASMSPEQIGYYKRTIQVKDIQICKCENEFIDAYISLEKPISHYVMCQNFYIDNILEYIVSQRELRGINAMDFTLYDQQYNMNNALNEKEVIDCILKDKKISIEFEKMKWNDAVENRKECLEHMDKKEYYEFKCQELFKDFQKFRTFYTHSLVLKEKYGTYIESYFEMKEDEEITSEIKNVFLEMRRKESKVFYTVIESILDLFYPLPEMEQRLHSCFVDKTTFQDDMELYEDLEMILLIFRKCAEELKGIQEINQKIHRNIKRTIEPFEYDKELVEIQTYIESWASFLKCYILSIQSNTLVLELNKIIATSEKRIHDATLKINHIYERLLKNDCCPICYEFMESEYYVSIICCQNKICKSCIDAWYGMEKKSCIFCNQEKIGLEQLKYVHYHIQKKEESNETGKEKTDEEKSQTSDAIHYEIVKDTKSIYIHKWMKEISTDPHKKVILFSDYSTVFEYFKKIAERYGIQYTDLEKGNMVEIDRAVIDYKQGNAKILLCNSALFGCGMNFENSTDIMFVHKMDAKMEEQVIGRAQRQGRKGQLHIYYLHYENELVKHTCTQRKDVVVRDVEAQSVEDYDVLYPFESLGTHPIYDETIVVPDRQLDIIDVNEEMFYSTLGV
jgi:hypothetical protein